MQVWRIHIRPDADQADSFRLCLKQQVLGVGWALEHPPSDRADGKACLEQAHETYKKEGEKVWRSCRSALTALASMAEGDFVWTRDLKGVYYLAKVIGPYEYHDEQENLNADICHLRKVRLLKIPDPSQTPGKVIASMRARRTIQRIYGEAVHKYSQYLFAKRTGDGVVPNLTGQDIFAYLSDQECEDVVFVMLQRTGWVVFPASRKADTMSYEYILRNVADGSEAVAQVRTGNSPINLDCLPEGVPVFVFQPNNCYEGDRRERVTKLDRREVLAFMRNNRKLLPGTVQDWMQMVRISD